MNFSKKNLGRNVIRREEGEDIGQVTQFDFTEFRESDWSNVLTSHSDAKAAFLWDYADHKMSKVPVETSQKQVQVSSVCVTQCGNFGIIGYLNGAIQKFNMQSGKDRGFLKAQGKEKVHTAKVTGLGIDYLNKFLISASLDGTIKQWDFYRGLLLKSVSIGCPEHLIYNRMNDLVAVSTSQLEVKVFSNISGAVSTL